MAKGITAVIWDFDHTLGDRGRKNYNVTRIQYERITGRSADKFPLTYAEHRRGHQESDDHREFYRKYLGYSEPQIDMAERYWTEDQLRDNTPVRLLPGIKEVINSLNGFPQGIVSLNSRRGIVKFLEEAGLQEYFGCVVGYEEVGNQKPSPEGLMQCIDELTDLVPGHVFYIGDQKIDIETACNANEVLMGVGLPIQVVTIAALHGVAGDTSDWDGKPDYIAREAQEIVGAIEDFRENGYEVRDGGLIVPD